jgi:hypothetical protein
MTALDREWLHKALIAARVFDETHGLHTAEQFVQWLYEQYGIKFPQD